MDGSPDLTKPSFLMLKLVKIKILTSVIHPRANIDALECTGLMHQSPLTEDLSNLWELKISIIPNNKDFFPLQLFKLFLRS